MIISLKDSLWLMYQFYHIGVILNVLYHIMYFDQHGIIYVFMQVFYIIVGFLSLPLILYVVNKGNSEYLDITEIKSSEIRTTLYLIYLVLFLILMISLGSVEVFDNLSISYLALLFLSVLVNISLLRLKRQKEKLFK